MTAAVLKQTICARAGNTKTIVESVTPHDDATRTRPTHKKTSLARFGTSTARITPTGTIFARRPRPCIPLGHRTGKTKKTSPIIARCDRDAHRARARRLAYRVDVRTHGPIRANGHVALRDLSRDDRDARQSRARESIAPVRIESYRVSRARGSRSNRIVVVSYLCDARVALQGGSSGDGRLGGDDVRVRERGGGHDDVSVCADARDDGAREAPSAAHRVGAWCLFCCVFRHFLCTLWMVGGS